MMIRMAAKVSQGTCIHRLIANEPFQMIFPSQRVCLPLMNVMTVTMTYQCQRGHLQVPSLPVSLHANDTETLLINEPLSSLFA